MTTPTKKTINRKVEQFVASYARSCYQLPKYWPVTVLRGTALEPIMIGDRLIVGLRCEIKPLG